MSEDLKPVLIAGAGPTDMMAAIELSRFNIPVRLIERKAEPETSPRAIGVHARTLELLEQRGLGSSLVKLGNPGLTFSLYGDGKRIWRLDFEQISSKYNYSKPAAGPAFLVEVGILPDQFVQHIAARGRRRSLALLTTGAESFDNP